MKLFFLFSKARVTQTFLRDINHSLPPKTHTDRNSPFEGFSTDLDPNQMETFQLFVKPENNRQYFYLDENFLHGYTLFDTYKELKIHYVRFRRVY